MQVATFESRALQVGLTEVDFVQKAGVENNFGQFEFVKRREVEEAIRKAQTQQKRVAIVEINPDNFAFFESDIFKSGVSDFGVAEVAFRESAVDKFAVGKVGIGEIAAVENTIFVAVGAVVFTAEVLVGVGFFFLHAVCSFVT